MLQEKGHLKYGMISLAPELRDYEKAVQAAKKGKEFTFPSEIRMYLRTTCSTGCIVQYAGFRRGF